MSHLFPPFSLSPFYMPAETLLLISQCTDTVLSTWGSFAEYLALKHVHMAQALLLTTGTSRKCKRKKDKWLLQPSPLPHTSSPLSSEVSPPVQVFPCPTQLLKCWILYAVCTLQSMFCSLKRQLNFLPSSMFSEI